MSIILTIFGLLSIVAGVLLCSSILFIGAGVAAIGTGILMLGASRGLELLSDIAYNTRKSAALLDEQFNPK